MSALLPACFKSRQLLPLALLCLLPATPGYSQTYTVSPAQAALARQVAERGVPLSALAADAPEQHTVQPGDTLWSLAQLFLRSPWQWPELWGMNLQEVQNPHLIYPGQQLQLLRQDGRASLRMTGSNPSGSGQDASLPAVRLSPRIRATPTSSALATLPANGIEQFLTQSMIVEADTLRQAPRIVATQENRVLLTRGDRAYARGTPEAPMLADAALPRSFHVFRPATALRDPVTREILGHEIQLVGQALLRQSEGMQEVVLSNGRRSSELVPATIDIVAAQQEIRVGDGLLPAPARGFTSYAPRAPGHPVQGRIVAVHGSAVANAAQNQVVIINRGLNDGLENGHVLVILKDGARLPDKTDPAQPMLKLPDERNGLLMVFRAFDRLSYALVLQITDGVKIGDRLATPQ